LSYNYDLVVLYLVGKLFSKLQCIKIQLTVYFKGFIAKKTKPKPKMNIKLAVIVNFR